MKVDINNTEVEVREVEKSTNPMYNKVPEEPKYIISADKLLDNKYEEIPYLWKPFFQKVGLVGLVGGSDTGKSTLLREFAMALVSGEKDYLGFDLKPEHKSVLYLSTEDDEYAISSLIKKQNIEGKESSDYKNFNYIFDTYDFKQRLEEELQRIRYDCIIIDAFSDIFYKDINRVNDIRSFLQIFNNLANKHKLLVIILHHTGKGAESNKPSKNNILGSQGFEAKMRLVAELRIDPNDESLRHLCITKGNYLPIEQKEKSYVLTFEDLKFTNTGLRVVLEDIYVKEDSDEKREMKAHAIQLRGQGLSVRKVVEKMIEDGYVVSIGTIQKWTKDTYET
ncbi:AAA family ATPase [Bacteroidota bacterium]